MLLVTGSTGNVGAAVSKPLITERPIPFRIAAHHPDKLKKLYGPDIPVVAFDYGDQCTWPAALEGIDTVFLVFPLPHPRNINRWMKPFINQLATRSIRHIVYLDVPGSESSSAIPHYHSERHIEASGVPYTFLRASYFMQNLCRGLSTHGVDIVDQHQLFIPGGHAKMTVLDARDVAEVVVKIMAEPEPHQNRAYTLAGPENIDLIYMAEVLSDVLGYTVAYANPNVLQFSFRLWRRHVKWDTILFMNIVYTLTRRGQNAPMSPDLEALLGRCPTTFRQFVEQEKWRWETRTWT